jgi:TonB-linked SusC/RagA family outer membrane protein
MNIDRVRSLLVGVFLLGLTFAASTPATAQQGIITGRVVDQSTQQPVVGVQVTIASTNLRGITDQDGRFRIEGVPPGRVIVMARTIGYAAASQPVTVVASEIVELNLAMTPGAVSLDEVVVTATGEQPLRSIPNAVSTIDAADIANKAPVTNFSDLLNSRTAGLTVTSSGGTTGSATRVRIRGSNSVSLSNEPVIYIDGIRVDNSANSTSIAVGGQQPSRLNDINPEDIESIEVIKGPAATALYGTAAANGIIQIRTKQGVAGGTRWNAYVEAGSIRDYLEYPANYASDCLLIEDADGDCTPTERISFNPLEANPPFQTGSRQQYGLNVAGGSSETTYFLSGEVEAENGIYEINALDKVNLRANVRAQLNPRLDLALSTGYVTSDLRRPENDNNSFGILASGLLGLPDSTNGGYGFLTPEQSMSIETNQSIDRFTGSLNGNWQPLGWLRARGVVGLDLTQRFDESTVFPGEIPAAFSPTAFEGSRNANRYQILNTTASLNATATFDLTSSLRSSTSVGVQFLRDYLTGTRAGGRKLVAGTNSLADVVVPSVNEETEEAKTLGVFIEEQLGVQDRLFFTAAIRGDDNSAFGQEFDFIAYPKLGASWVISDESFFPTGAALGSLRLRAAWGLSGLQPGTTDALQYFSGVAVTSVGADVPGFTFGNLGNQELKPERAREIELGFDADLLGDRAHLEFTYYDKKSTDALIARVIAPSIGAQCSTLPATPVSRCQTQFFNLGEVSNKGVEVALDARVLTGETVSLELGISGWGNRNRVVELGEDIEPIIFGLGGASQRHQEGYPSGAFFVLPFTYNDANGDGLIGSNEVTVGTEPTYHGTPFPTHGGTLNATLRVKNIVQLYVLFDGRFGHRQFNSTEEFRCGFVICEGLHDPSASQFEQARAIAAALAPTTTESGFIEKADFVKLREVSLTLTAPQSIARAFRAGDVSLTLSGRNLATWTDYTGLDPEILGGGASNFNTFEFLSQPPVRYFTARINVTF